MAFNYSSLNPPPPPPRIPGDINLHDGGSIATGAFKAIWPVQKYPEDITSNITIDLADLFYNYFIVRSPSGTPPASNFIINLKTVPVGTIVTFEFIGGGTFGVTMDGVASSVSFTQGTYIAIRFDDAVLCALLANPPV